VATLRAETTPSKGPVLGLDSTEEAADKNPADARSVGLHDAAGRWVEVIDTSPEDPVADAHSQDRALNRASKYFPADESGSLTA
jgi:hypothetical protein